MIIGKAFFFTYDEGKKTTLCRGCLFLGCAWLLLLGAALRADAQQVVGYWKLDEGAGKIPHDVNGRENHGGIATLLVAAQRAHAPAPLAASPGQQVGKVLSVRKVLANPSYYPSRYPRIHYYALYFSVRVSDQTYCVQYNTPVLDEIDDLFAAEGKEVEVVLEKKRLLVLTPHGRKLETHLLKSSKESTATPSQSRSHFGSTSKEVGRSSAPRRTGNS